MRLDAFKTNGSSPPKFDRSARSRRRYGLPASPRERLAARAIREGKNLEAIVAEILESASK